MNVINCDERSVWSVNHTYKGAYLVKEKRNPEFYFKHKNPKENKIIDVSFDAGRNITLPPCTGERCSWHDLSQYNSLKERVDVKALYELIEQSEELKKVVSVRKVTTVDYNFYKKLAVVTLNDACRGDS